jgi:hypothetical protein
MYGGIRGVKLAEQDSLQNVPKANNFYQLTPNYLDDVLHQLNALKEAVLPKH